MASFSRLRKRNSVSTHAPKSSSIPHTPNKTRRRRNYGEITLYCAIFLSSPLLLLFLSFHFSTLSPSQKTLVPISNHHFNNNDIEKQQSQGEIPYFKQQQAKLRQQHKTNDSRGIQIQKASIHDNLVFQIRQNTTALPLDTKIPVLVWPYINYGAGTAELIHFAENGLANESQVLELSNNVHNFDPNIVWIGDFGFAFSPATWCQAFHEVLIDVRQERKRQGLSLEMPIFIVDWSDTTATPRCTDVEKLFGREWVHYYIRNVVTGRKWNSSSNWVDIGTRVELPSKNYHHVPLFVRTDTVEALESVLQQDYNTTLASDITTLPKSIDVSHFWPLDDVGVKETRRGQLRHHVSDIISNLTTPTLRVFVGLAGSALQAGRRHVKSAYIQAMLDSKIVVVSQRDGWEDHYRLFEALVSGAMVMTDRMLSLPDGLQNGVSLVEYASADQLRDQILYYCSHENERLEIARRGREVAMRHHRTWHRVEQVVFSRELSDCSISRHGSACPWIVHAS